MPGREARESGYVPYVDGLRAVAILAVVGYHIGLPGFGGGFVGVDVFFVISGFLIIGHIAAGLESGRFSLVDFYARRALRLLPLLLTVILAACALAPFILVTPEEYKDFGGAARSAAVMLSNQFFLENQGYFDRAADTKPLLHTWSLGVEAQFYAVAPILLWAMAAITGTGGAGPARRRGWYIGGWLLVTALSLLGCVWFSTVGHNAAFFMAVFRAWEFAAGAAASALALRLRRLPQSAIDACGLLGLAVIVFCATAYDASLVYPSAWPVLPVIGATLVIASGQASAQSAVKRLLSLRPLVGIGLVSYGWYLWHWPLIAFRRIHDFGAHDLGADAALGGLLGLILATATYVAVERPVARHKSVLLARGRLVTLATGLACCFVAAIPGHVFAKVVARGLERQLGAEAWPDKTNLHRVADACIMSDGLQLSADCSVTASPKLGLLVGDSHAREAYRPLSERAASAGARLITMVQSGCPPLFDIDVLLQGQPQGCAENWRAGLGSLANAHAPVSFAVLESSWSLYLGGESNGRPPRFLAAEEGTTRAGDQAATLRQGLALTIRRLRNLGVRRILVVAPEPQFLKEAPECLLRTQNRGIDADLCSRPLAEIDAAHRATLVALQAVTQGSDDIRLIDPFEALCDGQRCWQHRDRIPLYIDDNHLSRRGLELVYARFAADLAWVLGSDAASLR